MDFYLYLPSDTGDFDTNSLGHYKVKLPQLIKLSGDWEVALVEISYPVTWFNVSSDTEALLSLTFKQTAETRAKLIPYNKYSSIDQLCDALNYTMDSMLNRNFERANFIFKYDPINHRVGLTPLSKDPEPNVRFVKLSKRIAYMLGFDDETISTSEAYIEFTYANSREIHHKTLILEDLSPETMIPTAGSFEPFNNLFEEAVDGTGRRPNCKLVYDESASTLHVTRASATEPINIEYIKLSESLQKKLGLSDNVLLPNESYSVNPELVSLAPAHYLMADTAPDVRAGNYSLFVYCDIVAPQIIGNVIAPVLRIVSINGKYDDVVVANYDSPHYVPVLKREFGTVEININHNTGDAVRFQYGKVYVKLHFRKQ